jgi:IS30 family transposase
LATDARAPRPYATARISVEDRRSAVKELASEGLSQRVIADVIGVHQETVCNDLKNERNPVTEAPSPMEEMNSGDRNPVTERNQAPPVSKRESIRQKNAALAAAPVEAPAAQFETIVATVFIFSRAR